MRPSPNPAWILATALLAGCPSTDGEHRGPSAMTTSSPVSAPPSSTLAPPGSSPAPKTMDVITITENTQATHGDLKIGAGNIWEDDYVDASGAKKKGPTAGLWIYVRNDDAKNQTVRVHPGQVLKVATYTLEVKGVTDDSVSLAISP